MARSKQSEITDVWGAIGALIVLAALPWIFSAGISYFMLAWRTIP